MVDADCGMRKVSIKPLACILTLSDLVIKLVIL